jgi:formate dehydrogenase maturation protein FdhE
LRIRRAEQIASEYEFAAEFLAFYKHVALFQKYLYEKIAASTEVTSRTTPAKPLRAELDLALLLPHFREYLTVIEHSAPSALKESAHQMALLPTDSWIASLQGYWENGGRDEQDIGAFDQFLPRAFLQPYAEYRASLAPSPPLFMTTRACPLCGARPLLGVLRPEGDGGKRFLMCSFCSLEWEFRRIFCAKCGEEKEQKLPVYVAEQFPHIRMECCETCRHFLRTIDLTKDGNAVPLVDDLAAVPLSLWAEENGYERIQGNLLGT